MNRKPKRAVILIGAKVGQDHGMWMWPEVPCPVVLDTVDFNTIFDCEPTAYGWRCVAFGYGQHGAHMAYGNGAIAVYRARDLLTCKIP